MILESCVKPNERRQRQAWHWCLGERLVEAMDPRFGSFNPEVELGMPAVAQLTKL